MPKHGIFLGQKAHRTEIWKEKNKHENSEILSRSPISKPDQLFSGSHKKSNPRKTDGTETEESNISQSFLKKEKVKAAAFFTRMLRSGDYFLPPFRRTDHQKRDLRLGGEREREKWKDLS